MKKHQAATNVILTLTATLGLLLAGCSEQPMSPISETPDTPTVSAYDLEPYILSSKPDNALPVGEARQQMKPGEAIVVKGQIAATLHPFSDGYASFTLGDEVLMYCDEMGDDDHCPTPWDACCEDPDKIKINRASVQIAEDGNPLPVSLKGIGGLKELDHVIVVGTADPSSTPDNLIINATGIYRGQ